MNDTVWTVALYSLVKMYQNFRLSCPLKQNLKIFCMASHVTMQYSLSHWRTSNLTYIKQRLKYSTIQNMWRTTQGEHHSVLVITESKG
jgi:hypothetical protein